MIVGNESGNNTGEHCPNETKGGQVVKKIYRNYIIERAGSEAREWEWYYTHKDYDGPEDSRYGFAKTEEDARREIDRLEDEDLQVTN